MRLEQRHSPHRRLGEEQVDEAILGAAQGVAVQSG